MESAAVFGRNGWRDWIGNGGGFESESLALLVRNTHDVATGAGIIVAAWANDDISSAAIYV